MVLVGVDGSYTRTGLTVLDDVARTINMYALESVIGEKTFPNHYRAARVISDGVLKKVPEGELIKVIIEEPFPGGEYSPGLYCLDTLIISALISERMVVEVYSMHTSWLGHIFMTRNHTKTDSVKLAKEIIAVFVASGYSVPRTRITHDEAESLLFTSRLFVLNNECVS